MYARRRRLLHKKRFPAGEKRNENCKNKGYHGSGKSKPVYTVAHSAMPGENFSHVLYAEFSLDNAFDKIAVSGEKRARDARARKKQNFKENRIKNRTLLGKYKIH